MKKFGIAFYCFFLEIYNGYCFQLVSNSNHKDEVSVDAGNPFHMECIADSHYEYCVFEHNGNKVMNLAISYTKLGLKWIWTMKW